MRNREAQVFIAERKPFKNSTGSFHGAWVSYYPKSYGKLQDQLIKELVHEVESHANVYIVYSYETPIAWWSAENGWRIPSVRYSVTTSKHQGLVGSGIAIYSPSLI